MAQFNKDERIGREFRLFNEKLKKIEWLFGFFYSHKIDMLGCDFVFYNGADHVVCVVCDIDWEKYEITYAVKNADPRDTFYDGSNFQTLTMENDNENGTM